MTNRISTYDDLLAEKQRLTVLLQVQKEVVRQDFREIKEELMPVKSMISMVGKFATRDKSSWLLTTAADKVIDLVFKKMLLARAGWFTKLAVPFLMKNFSSHVIADNKEGIMSKVFSLFGKKKKQEDQEEEEQDEYVHPRTPASYANGKLHAEAED